MFCSKCGNEIPNDAMFCPECGTSVERKEEPVVKEVNDMPEVDATYNAEAKPTKKVSINISKKVKILLLVLIIGVAGFFGYRHFSEDNSCDDPIDSLVTGIKEKDIEKIISVIPDPIIDEYSDKIGFDLRNIASLMNNPIFESAFDEAFEEFKGVELSYTISKRKDCTESEILDIKADIKDETGVDLDIKEAKKLTATLYAKSNGKTESDTDDIIVIKVGRKWYIDPVSFGIF